MGDLSEPVRVTDSLRLPPDPTYINSIGLNHDLVTAVADLVDNSIDAGASNVLVRFVRDASRVQTLYVVDDGHGISEEDIDRAMTIGGRREYRVGELGYFGIGMKASSLGQAGSLTVLSRTKGGAVGRRWLKEKATKGFECDVVDKGFANEILDQSWGSVECRTGTVIRWDDVGSFPSTDDPRDADNFLEETVRRLRQHLGLTFHRILQRDGLQIVIDVEDRSEDGSGVPSAVAPIDPFGYQRSPLPDYPRSMSVDFDERTIELKCHIWPGRSQLAGFKLPGPPPVQRQGFYFYRNDRLLQGGGWNGVLQSETGHQLARVSIDVDGDMGQLFGPNPEKTKVGVPPLFVSGVHAARFPDGGTIKHFVNEADHVFKESNRRSRARRRVIPPGRGLAPPIRKAIAAELDYLPGEDPIEIRWMTLDSDKFFDVDLDERRIILNRYYRWAVLGDQNSSLNDTPLVKALLYLLVERLFNGSYLGPRDKDDLVIWQNVLTAAAEAERG